MTTEISTARVIAGAVSFFVPGLGHLILNRISTAAFYFLLALVLWPTGIIMMTGDVHGGVRAIPALLEIPAAAAVILSPGVLAAYFAANGKF